MRLKKPKITARFAILPENEAEAASLYLKAGYTPVAIERSDGLVRFCFDAPDDQMFVLSQVIPRELYALRAYVGGYPFDTSATRH